MTTQNTDTNESLPNRIFAFKRPDGGNSWHTERLESSDVEYVRASPPASPSEQQPWCDHCSADLNGVKHILCERCYREYANSINTRETLRAAILDWLAHRCDYAPVCGKCTYCRVATFVQTLEPAAAVAATPSPPSETEITEWGLEAGVSVGPVSETPVGGEARDDAKQLIQDLASFPFDVLMDENAPRIAIIGSVSTLRHMQARAQEIVAAPVVATGDDEGDDSMNTITFGDSKNTANPDVSCPKCGGTKPTCCRCPDERTPTRNAK